MRFSRYGQTNGLRPLFDDNDNSMNNFKFYLKYEIAQKVV